MPQVMAKATHAVMELLKDDDLRLDFADLFCDYLLRKFFQDNETLLDNLDLLGVADSFFLLDYNLATFGTIKVSRAIEVVKVSEGCNAMPIVEGDGAGTRPRHKVLLNRDWFCDGTCGDGQDQGQVTDGVREHNVEIT